MAQVLLVYAKIATWKWPLRQQRWPSNRGNVFNPWRNILCTCLCVIQWMSQTVCQKLTAFPLWLWFHIKFSIHLNRIDGLFDIRTLDSKCHCFYENAFGIGLFFLFFCVIVYSVGIPDNTHCDAIQSRFCAIVPKSQTSPILLYWALIKFQIN